MRSHDTWQYSMQRINSVNLKAMISAEEKVNNALDSIRPFLKEDGGDVELVTIQDGIVKIKLLGACQTCDISHITMKAGVEESIKRAIPEIKEVIAVN